jgi:hypothetical protein
MYQTAATIKVAEQLNTEFVLPTKSHAGHYGDISPDFSGFSYPFKFQDVNLPNKISQPTFGYTPLDIKDDAEMHGFYQAHQYFDDIRDKLINKYFKFKDEVIEKASKYKIPANSTGISVRRGDYLQLQNNHCVLSTRYYGDSIGNIHQKYGLQDIFFFSDDIPWCRTQVATHDSGDAEWVHYIEDDKWVQLYLMTQMKHLILSNSTFAWWGGYLNDKGGTIIIPDPWFGPANDHHDSSGLYCPNWVRQKHERVLA